MEPKDFSRRETHYHYVAWGQPAMQRLREDIEEQELVDSDLIEAKMVLAYIMQKK